MASIYNTDIWKNTIDYGINDIVVRNERFFYAVKANGPNTSDGAQTPVDGGSAFWQGVLTVPPFDKKPYFFWRPSYSVTVSTSPRIKTVRFGDGYEQRMKDGINNTLLSFDLKFDNRDEKEATAILHFLTSRGGFESFYYKPPAPYSIYKNFICNNFSSSNVFMNNFNITVKLDEVAP